MKKKPVWKKVILVLEVIVEAILLLAMCSTTDGYLREKNVQMIPYGIVFSLCGCFWLAITMAGFRRYRENQKYILSTGFGMKILVAWFGLVSLWVPFYHEHPNYSIVLFICLSILFVAFHRATREKRRENLAKIKKDENHMLLNKPQFQSYKSKWVWDDAASEYSKWKGKELAEFTDEDNEKIYGYATNPMIYFFSWIVKHNGCSDLFYETYVNGNVELNLIKSEAINPCEFVSAYMDYGWFRDDITSFFLDFVDYYFEGHRYEDDYNYILVQEDKRYYCHEFSWDTYHKLEKLMDEQYKFFLFQKEDADATVYEESTLPDVPWHRTKQMLELHVAEDVAQKYVDKCVEHLNRLSEVVLREICDYIFMNFVIDVNYEAIEENHMLILDQLCEGSMHIYTPHGDEAAFILGFESDIEPEHGISIVIRGDEYTEIGYRMDSSSPWTYDNDFVYHTKRQRKENQVLVVQPKANESGFRKSMTVPKIVADRLMYLEEKVVRLVRTNAADTFCIEAYNKNEKDMPEYILVDVKKDGRNVFYERIQVL